MWGYSIAAAKHGVVHKAMRELQIETGATRRRFEPDFWAGYRIFHYTYGLEWTLNGQPQGTNQVGAAMRACAAPLLRRLPVPQARCTLSEGGLRARPHSGNKRSAHTHAHNLSHPVPFAVDLLIGRSVRPSVRACAYSMWRELPFQIGEWSLDKRHYGGAYPPRNLQLPPDTGHSAHNHAPRWLTLAWNEASAGIADWPPTKAMGTVGWRREAPTAAQLAASALASQLVGSKWQWGGVSGLVFGPLGALTTPWGTGKWGNLPPDDAGEAIFCDFASALHNLRFDLAQGTFVSERVGDGEKVMGTREAAA